MAEPATARQGKANVQSAGEGEQDASRRQCGEHERDAGARAREWGKRQAAEVAEATAGGGGAPAGGTMGARMRGWAWGTQAGSGGAGQQQLLAAVVRSRTRRAVSDGERRGDAVSAVKERPA